MFLKRNAFYLKHHSLSPIQFLVVHDKGPQNNYKIYFSSGTRIIIIFSNIYKITKEKQLYYMSYVIKFNSTTHEIQ